MSIEVLRLFSNPLQQIRLNERNVVELINKLNQLGFLGDGLLHTVNGREYITPEHLRKELLQAVDQAGGRMSLVSSAHGMHVARCHMQTYAPAS